MFEQIKGVEPSLSKPRAALCAIETRISCLIELVDMSFIIDGASNLTTEEKSMLRRRLVLLTRSKIDATI